MKNTGDIMGKSKIQKSYVILGVAYLAMLIVLSLMVDIGNADDIIKYWGASGMHSGLKLYKDINIFVPPLSCLVSELSLYIVDSLITIRILNAFVWLAIFIFIHKICNKYEVNKYTVAIFNVAVVIYAFARGNFYYDYNIISFLFALIALYYILNKEFNAKNAVIIALFCSLIIWTKHTMGAVFFIITAISLLMYNKKDKKFAKNVGLMFITGIAVSALFVIYLVCNGILDDFINLAILGVGDFGSNFLFSFGIEWFYFAALVIAVVVKVVISKEKDLDIGIIFLFALGCVAYLYPIVDYAHLMPLCLTLIILFLKLTAKKEGKVNVIVTGTSALVLFSVVVMCSWTMNGERIQSKIPAYKNLPITPAFEERINEIDNFISEVDGEVYIIDKYAMIYNLAMGVNRGYYDHLWNGNTGSLTPLEYVKLLEEKDCYVFINTNSAEEYQWDSNIHKYIQENYEYVDEMGKWKLYHVEKSEN